MNVLHCVWGCFCIAVLMFGVASLSVCVHVCVWESEEEREQERWRLTSDFFFLHCFRPSDDSDDDWESVQKSSWTKNTTSSCETEEDQSAPEGRVRGGASGRARGSRRGAGSGGRQEKKWDITFKWGQMVWHHWAWHHPTTAHFPSITHTWIPANQYSYIQLCWAFSNVSHNIYYSNNFGQHKSAWTVTLLNWRKALDWNYHAGLFKKLCQWFCTWAMSSVHPWQTIGTVVISTVYHFPLVLHLAGSGSRLFKLYILAVKKTMLQI